MPSVTDQALAAAAEQRGTGGSLRLHGECFQRGHGPHFVPHFLKRGEFDCSGEICFPQLQLYKHSLLQGTWCFPIETVGEGVCDGKGVYGHKVTFGLEEGAYDFLPQAGFQGSCSFGASVYTLTFM